MQAETIKNKLISLADNDKATVLASFFQTKKGQYSHGDVFWE